MKWAILFVAFIIIAIPITAFGMLGYFYGGSREGITVVECEERGATFITSANTMMGGCSYITDLNGDKTAVTIEEIF